MGAVGSHLPGEKVLIGAPICCSPNTWQVHWEGSGIVSYWAAGG